MTVANVRTLETVKEWHGSWRTLLTWGRGFGKDATAVEREALPMAPQTGQEGLGYGTFPLRYLQGTAEHQPPLLVPSAPASDYLSLTNAWQSMQRGCVSEKRLDTLLSHLERWHQRQILTTKPRTWTHVTSYWSPDEQVRWDSYRDG